MNTRSTILEVDTVALVHNYKTYEKLTQKDVYAVVKANAYGLGMIKVAEVFESENVTMLCVATLDEALELREAKIKTPILVMGYTPLDSFHLAKESSIHLTITSIEQLEAIKMSSLTDLLLHLKINTSMNRLGIELNDERLKPLIHHVSKTHSIEGIFTHFAINEMTALASAFQLFKNYVISLDFSFKSIHAKSSKNSLMLSEDFTTAVRIGIGLYDNDLHEALKPVVRLVSEVVALRTIQSGESVGYNGIFAAHTPTKIATIPIGYGDGILRSDKQQDVFINNVAYPIVGNVCMDQLMVMVDDRVSDHDEVELFGHNQSVEAYALKRDTINYEVLTLLSQRIQRVYK